jgi:hypothetical protein
VQPLVPTRAQVETLDHTLVLAKGLVVDTTTLVSDLRQATASSAGPIARARETIDATLKRALGYLVALGAAWSLMFWGGAILSNRFRRERSPRPAQG